jgi:uncharacterized protein YodC (DUF2158 family)
MSRNRSAAARFAAIVLVGFVCVWGDPGNTEPARPNAQAKTNAPASVFATGDLVRLRSGGPLMIVEKMEGNQVFCRWSTGFGELRSGSFSRADLSALTSPPPPDQNLQKEEAAADRYYKKHCPRGFVTFTGKFQCAL